MICSSLHQTKSPGPHLRYVLRGGIRGYLTAKNVVFDEYTFISFSILKAFPGCVFLFLSKYSYTRLALTYLGK